MATLTFEKWTDVDKRAAELSMMYDKFQSYRDTNRKRWEEIEAYVFSTDCTTLPGLNNYDHTTHIPMVAEIKDEAEAIMYNAVMPHEDFLGWNPFSPDAETMETRQKITAFIRNRHTLNGFESTVRKLIQDLVIYGNCFCQVRYVSEDNGEGGYVGPRPYRISPYDIVFDPTRTSFEESPKFIRTMWTIGELMEWAEVNDIDEDALELIKDRRGTFGSLSKTENNKNKQFVPDGFTDIQAYYASGMVELLWFYGDVYDAETSEVKKDQLVVVADRCGVILEQDEPHPNIFKGSWSEKPDNLWSQGPLDRIIGLNYQVNHRENSKSGALDRYIYPDRVMMGQVELFYDEEENSKIYQATEGGGVRDLVPDTTVLTADMHIDRLRNDARLAAGLPPQMQGFRTPGEKTFGEVQNLESAAMRKFLHRAAQFEMDCLEKIVSAEIRIGRENFHAVIQASSTNEDGLPILVEITEADLSANGKLVPMGARRFARRTQQQAMLNLLANSNLGQLIGPHISSYKLAKAVEELGEFGDWGLIDKWVTIEEQGEAQLKQAVQEQQLTRTMGNQSFEESMLE